MGSDPLAGSPLDPGAWRAVETLRLVGLVYAGVMVRLHQAEMTRPWVAWATLAVLTAWAGWISLRRLRSPWAVLVELLLACAGVLLSVLVHPAEAIRAGATTIPGMYAAAPVVAAAVVGGTRAGVLAATAVTVANVLVVGRPSGATVYNSLLLYAAAAGIGMTVELARRGAAAGAEVTRMQAEAAERERLARVVHDGVLQHLAYIHRRGTQLGGEAAELARLAADSERELRSFVSVARPPSTAASDAGARTDLGAALAALGEEGVQVVLPATTVDLPPRLADELVAAVTACLDNVRRHAGPGARAWVLLEQLPDRVEVTVRDDGVGIRPGRLEEAAREGRLGVACSIEGRVRDLGGTVTHGGGPGRGTVVHLQVPVPADGAVSPRRSS